MKKTKKETWKRQPGNAINGLLTIGFLLFALQLSDQSGQFATKINEITQTLSEAVLRLDSSVDYSNFTNNAVYGSSASFRAAGMAGLYNLTNAFIDSFTPDDMLMSGVLTSTKNGIEVNLPNAKKASQYYAKLIAIVTFLVVCIVMFPLCGCCLWCCRCCGNCGAKSQPSDKKKDTCKKVMLASLLIMCGTGLLFCIVCAFGSNQQLQDGLEALPTNLNHSLQDSKTYMDTTNKEVRYLLDTNYNEFSSALNILMTNASDVAMELLMDFDQAQSVSTIEKFVGNLAEIKTSLNQLKVDTNKMRVYASQLNDALRKVKRDLQTSLNECTTAQCTDLKVKIQNLQTNIHFDQIPDVSDTIASLDKIDDEAITTEVNKGKESLNNIQNEINKTLTDGLTDARKQIAKAGTTIEENLVTVTDTVNELKDQIDSFANPLVKNAQSYVDQYGKYRYIAGVTISCILLLVTICIVCGLICGVCGKRPDGYSDNCCNKGTGGQYLLCGVFIMFVCGFIISVFTLCALLFGVFSEKVVCDPLKNPDPTQYNIIQLIDDIDFNVDVDFTPSTLIAQCHRNLSIYKVFNLETKFNIKQIIDNLNVEEQISSLSDALADVDLTGFSLTGDGALRELENFNPNIDVDQFFDELSGDLTNYNLDELANTLRKIIGLTIDANMRSSLELSLLHITTYEEKLIDPMKQLSEEIKSNAYNLNEQLKMGTNESFQVAITNLLDELDKVNEALVVNGKDKLIKVAEDFQKILLELINGYTDRITLLTENEIGRCGPLSLVINSTLTSTCDKVILPWNGYWFSLFSTIILYVVTIIISVKLANIYKKHKPYDQFVETEYLYDAYADRGDNIPLNRRGAKRGKKKGKKTRRYEERPNPNRDVARDYAAGSHPPDARYADMAPKHWEDFPNGGPPHYQRAPTEYERPPPYYYPGSGSEQ